MNKKKVRANRRQFVAQMVTDATIAARAGDWKVFYTKIRRLRPKKAHAFPVLKGKMVNSSLHLCWLLDAGSNSFLLSWLAFLLPFGRFNFNVSCEGSNMLRLHWNLPLWTKYSMFLEAAPKEGLRP
jgi:hypothetical protein